MYPEIRAGKVGNHFTIRSLKSNGRIVCILKRVLHQHKNTRNCLQTHKALVRYPCQNSEMVSSIFQIVFELWTGLGIIGAHLMALLLYSFFFDPGS